MARGIAYGFNNVQLLNALVSAAKKSGQTGLTDDEQQTEYLRWVMLARLDGARPPLVANELVKVKEGQRRAMSVTHVDFVHDYLEEERGPFRIARVWYIGGGRWALEFVGRPQHHYAVEDFERVFSDP